MNIKTRNPLVVMTKQMGKRVVKAKKGKGSFSRKQKHKGAWA